MQALPFPYTTARLQPREDDNANNDAWHELRRKHVVAYAGLAACHVHEPVVQARFEASAALGYVTDDNDDASPLACPGDAGFERTMALLRLTHHYSEQARAAGAARRWSEAAVAYEYAAGAADLAGQLAARFHGAHWPWHDAHGPAARAAMLRLHAQQCALGELADQRTPPAELVPLMLGLADAYAASARGGTYAQLLAAVWQLEAALAFVPGAAALGAHAGVVRDTLRDVTKAARALGFGDELLLLCERATACVKKLGEARLDQADQLLAPLLLLSHPTAAAGGGAALVDVPPKRIPAAVQPPEPLLDVLRAAADAWWLKHRSALARPPAAAAAVVTPVLSSQLAALLDSDALARGVLAAGVPLALAEALALRAAAVATARRYEFGNDTRSGSVTTTLTATEHLLQRETRV
jgi:hypothetical protein